MTVFAAELSSRLTTRRIGRVLEIRDEADSTNDLARQLADAGAHDGTLVLAHRQNAGRGRRGRVWNGLPGNHLYASFILRPAMRADRAFEITILASVALAETIETIGGRPSIKWPNDLELAGLKCAGILAEMATDTKGMLRHVVLGVGVNMDGGREDFPEELRDRATTLQASLGHAVSLVDLVAPLCSRLEKWLDRSANEGFHVVLSEWRRRSSTLGQSVRAISEGTELRGVAENVDEDGALLIRTTEGVIHRVVAGEVVHLRLA